MTYKKKLIEVALPLEAINKAAARAVIFAQMVDDPSAHPDIFPTEKKQEKERHRLFRIIEDMVLWENTTNEEVLQKESMAGQVQMIYLDRPGIKYGSSFQPFIGKFDKIHSSSGRCNL